MQTLGWHRTCTRNSFPNIQCIVQIRKNISFYELNPPNRATYEVSYYNSWAQEGSKNSIPIFCLPRMFYVTFYSITTHRECRKGWQRDIFLDSKRRLLGERENKIYIRLTQTFNNKTLYGPFFHHSKLEFLHVLL